MKTYWDHSEKERSELTADQVSDLLKYELMEQGVLAPEQPKYLPEDAPELPTTEYYTIKKGYSSSNLLFATADDAAHAAALCCGWNGSTYFSSKSLDHREDAELEIGTVKCVSQADIAKHRSALEQASANKKANEKARSDFQDAVKACDRVTEGVWDDWHSQGAKANRYQKIVDTYQEYLTLAEFAVDIAYGFLIKAFPAEDVQKAGEWHDDAFLAAKLVPAGPVDDDVE
jgi:hypothetical protein